MQGDCLNCNVALNNCTCGDTETFNENEGPICPFCGCLNEASSSDVYFECTEDSQKWHCDECGKLFFVNLIISMSWTSKRSN